MSSTGIPLNPFAFIRKYDELWTRLLFLIGALIDYRLGSHIPVPGINPVNLADLFSRNENTILSMFNMFSVGVLECMSIMSLDIMTYFSVSIIINMMSALLTSFEPF